MSSVEKGVFLGLATVVAIIVCGAVLNDKMPEPSPSPTDRPVVIVPQK